MGQLEMFKQAAPPATGKKPSGLKKPTISERFEAFLAGNPHVMPAMLTLARGKLRGGATRIGAKALWEDLREHLKTHHEGDYKLNNDYTALAARRLLELEPKLVGVIELRRRKAK